MISVAFCVLYVYTYDFSDVLCTIHVCMCPTISVVCVLVSVLCT